MLVSAGSPVLGHLSWVTCPGSLVIDSLVLGVLVVLGGNKYFNSLYLTLGFCAKLFFKAFMRTMFESQCWRCLYRVCASAAQGRVTFNRWGHAVLSMLLTVRAVTRRENCRSPTRKAGLGTRRVFLASGCHTIRAVVYAWPTGGYALS